VIRSFILGPISYLTVVLRFSWRCLKWARPPLAQYPDRRVRSWVAKQFWIFHYTRTGNEFLAEWINYEHTDPLWLFPVARLSGNTAAKGDRVNLSMRPIRVIKLIKETPIERVLKMTWIRDGGPHFTRVDLKKLIRPSEEGRKNGSLCWIQDLDLMMKW
jgi:hypothetical protein